MSLNASLHTDCIMNITYGISICLFHSFFFSEKKNVAVKFSKPNATSLNYLLTILLATFLPLKNIVNKKPTNTS